MSERISTEPVVEFQHISKHFAGVHALKDVSFFVLPGEVHAIVGENGAGKTTLMNLLGGQLQPDDGRILLNGHPERISSPLDALERGISVVHQEVTLCPNLSIAANLQLGREDRRLGFIPDRAAMNREARAYMDQLGLRIDPGSIVGSLPVAYRQLTEIARALTWQAKVIVMDEPNSALSSEETAALFDVIRNLKADGVTVLFISHRLEEVMEIADRITVLRDGSYMGTMNKTETSVEEIVRLMVGRSITSFFGAVPKPEQAEKVVLEARHISRAGKFRDVSFSVGQGEVIGLAGIQGAGRKAVVRSLFGLDQLDSGEVRMDGRPISIKAPIDAIRAGIAFVPEDRRNEGILREMSVQHNISSVKMDQLWGWQMLPWTWMRQLAEEWIRRLDIRCDSFRQRMANLSGGNQQKVVLAKWLASQPRLLILEEPTQGIDVGAKSEIYNIIRELAERGVSLIFISSELPELLALSTRILVLHSGQLVAEFRHEEATEDKIMLAATGSAALL